MSIAELGNEMTRKPLTSTVTATRGRVVPLGHTGLAQLGSRAVLVRPSAHATGQDNSLRVIVGKTRTTNTKRRKNRREVNKEALCTC